MTNVVIPTTPGAVEEEWANGSVSRVTGIGVWTIPTGRRFATQRRGGYTLYNRGKGPEPNGRVYVEKATAQSIQEFKRL